MKFDIDKLAKAIQATCPEIIFALLHGSAKNGRVGPNSDIDIALYLDGKATIEVYNKVSDIVNTVCPSGKADIAILNNADPVYRFEALKGKLLFTRNEEIYARFFSLTCREYESQMAYYERQHRYRLEAQKAKGY